MKKTKFPAFLMTAVVCFLFWLLITGQIVAIFQGGASLQVLIAGCIISLAAALFCSRFFIHENPFYLLRPDRFFLLLFYCLIIFPWELIKANVSQAVRAFGPKKLVRSGIVKIPTDLTSENGLAMLANSITLTPGTITMDVVEENGKNWCYIHWIDVASEDPEEAGKAIKGTLEKWIGRIWK